MTALCGVSFSVAAGEFVVISGSSGSGKSTLMNIIGCLDSCTSGDYFLSGRRVSSLSDRALSAVRGREIGFIFQGYNLVPTLTAEENVELPLLYRGVPRRVRRRLVGESLGAVGLESRRRHLPSQLSGGQQQRVSIARAIAGNPSIVLADEPTGNLDSRSGRAVIDLLYELQAAGRTVILITHDSDIAAAAPREIRIADGAVKADIVRR